MSIFFLARYQKLSEVYQIILQNLLPACRQFRMNQAVHIVDSLALGGAQRVLKTYFESEKNNRNVHLLALREVDDPVTIDHRNVKVSKGRGVSMNVGPPVIL